MKTLFRLLLAPIVWFFQACSPLGKPVDLELSDNFYYNKSKTDIIYSSMGNWFELGKASLNADANSFQVLNHHLGKDKDRAYYREHAITHPDLDLESFRASSEDWMWHIGMDKNSVYVFNHDVVDGAWKLYTKIIEKADPHTFRQYDYNWSKDATQHFYDYKVIPVDYESFKRVNDTFAKDEHQIYLYHDNNFKPCPGDAGSFRKIDRYHARDSSNIYFFVNYLHGEKIGELKSIPYESYSKVKVLEESHLIVGDQVYYSGFLIENANARRYEVLSEQYSKDDKSVFYEGKLIEGADAASFYYDEKEWVYKDKNNKYRGADVWNETENETSALNQTKDTEQASLLNFEENSRNSFEVTLVAKQDSYKKGEEIYLEVAVKNISLKSDIFCDYHTPFEGIQNDIFTMKKRRFLIPVK